MTTKWDASIKRNCLFPDFRPAERNSKDVHGSCDLRQRSGNQSDSASCLQQPQPDLVSGKHVCPKGLGQVKAF